MVRTNRPTKSNLTYFFTDDIDQLRKLLSKLGVMAHRHLDQRTGLKGEYIVFNKKLADDQMQYIKKNWKERITIENRKLITGFSGCLVTGYEFKYKKI